MKPIAGLPMKILALEFSSNVRSVALADNADAGLKILSTASEVGGRSTRAVGLIEKVLTEAAISRDQVDCIAIGIGPGSYTGIRAAIALAQGWQMATGIKTIGISSVEAIAAQAQEAGTHGVVNIVIDAQRQEFYLAEYNISKAHIQLTKELHLVTFEDVGKRAESGALIIGPDAHLVRGGIKIEASAERIAKLAAQSPTFVPAAELEPIYLREVNFVKAPPHRTIL